MERLILSARWPGLLAFLVGGLLLLWQLLMPQLEPRHMLRWGRGRVEHALVPLVGQSAAPGLAGTALSAAAVALLVGGVLSVWAMGLAGILLAPLVALGVGWAVANRQANRRRERLGEQVHGLSQALAAGLTGEGVTGGTVFTLLRRFYRQMDPPLREELAFLELVLRGQADLGKSLEESGKVAVDKNVRALLELLGIIYRESLDLAAQRRALRTLLERVRQEDRVRRSVRVESRFGQISQTIVLFLIPGFVVLAAVAGGMLGGQVSVLHFYFRTLPGRLIMLAAVAVEGIVVWLSRRMVRRIRWE